MITDSSWPRPLQGHGAYVVWPGYVRVYADGTVEMLDPLDLPPHIEQWDRVVRIDHETWNCITGEVTTRRIA